MSLNLKESPPTSECTIDRMVLVCGSSIRIADQIQYNIAAQDTALQFMRCKQMIARPQLKKHTTRLRISCAAPRGM
jgi:hypothetical protein